MRNRKRPKKLRLPALSARLASSPAVLLINMHVSIATGNNLLLRRDLSGSVEDMRMSLRIEFRFMSPTRSSTSSSVIRSVSATRTLSAGATRVPSSILSVPAANVNRATKRRTKTEVLILRFGDAVASQRYGCGWRGELTARFRTEVCSSLNRHKYVTQYHALVGGGCAFVFCRYSRTYLTLFRQTPLQLWWILKIPNATDQLEVRPLDLPSSVQKPCSWLGGSDCTFTILTFLDDLILRNRLRGAARYPEPFFVLIDDRNLARHLISM